MNNCKCEFKHIFISCLLWRCFRAVCFFFYRYTGDWVFEIRSYPCKTWRDVQRICKYATMFFFKVSMTPVKDCYSSFLRPKVLGRVKRLTKTQKFTYKGDQYLHEWLKTSRWMKRRPYGCQATIWYLKNNKMLKMTQ